MNNTITPEERAAIRSPSERWDALWYPHDRCHKMMLRLLNALEAAEAESARLRAERDWLARRCAEHCQDRWGCDCTCHVNGCAHENEMCSKPQPKDWKEAARRAVAAGEGE